MMEKVKDKMNPVRMLMRNVWIMRRPKMVNQQEQEGRLVDLVNLAAEVEGIKYSQCWQRGWIFSQHER